MDLFNLSKRPQWKFVRGGSYKYIEALINKKFIYIIHTNSKIKNIIRKNDKIYLVDVNENETSF